MFPLKVVTAQEMGELERRAKEVGISVPMLMENAGAAVAQQVLESWRERCWGGVLVLAGPGNNGGDGLVAARRLAAWRVPVTACSWQRRGGDDPPAEQALAAQVPFLRAEEDEGFRHLRESLAGASVIMDALLGTGRRRPIEGSLKELLAAVREGRGGRYLVALDLPSGLDGDTGEVDPATLPADLTVTLGLPKRGLFLFPGAAFVGRLVLADIGIPAAATADLPLQLLEPTAVAELLPPRPPGAHKGTFGRVLVVAGSSNFLGAPYLAAAAAMRVGAGLVTLAPPRSLHPILATKLTEATFLLLEEAEPGALSAAALPALLEAAANYEVLLVGPGLGRHPSTVQMVRGLAQALGGGQGPSKVVIDADALNALSGWSGWPELLGPGRVLTPHAGEMGRLLGCEAGEVERQRVDSACRSAAVWRQVVVLKGAYSIVAAPEGPAAICPVATPALATAGTGDILAGAIAGLMAQGLNPFPAAAGGVYLHACAGQRAAQRYGQAGPLAGDLLELLPEVIRQLKAAPPALGPLRVLHQ